MRVHEVPSQHVQMQQSDASACSSEVHWSHSLPAVAPHLMISGVCISWNVKTNATEIKIHTNMTIHTDPFFFCAILRVPLHCSMVLAYSGSVMNCPNLWSIPCGENEAPNNHPMLPPQPPWKMSTRSFPEGELPMIILGVLLHTQHEQDGASKRASSLNG